LRAEWRLRIFGAASGVPAVRSHSRSGLATAVEIIGDEVRIHRLTLATGDVAGQLAFWGKRLGLPVRAGADGAIEIALQASTIRFEQASSGTDPRYHFAINVPRGSIEQAAAWIEERHELLAFHGDPDVEEGATIAHTNRGASALYFLDSAGNVAELIANDHLDNGSDAPFGPDSFLEIAEIGVATSDTDATRAAIQEALSAEILWGGRVGWLLTAIGDDHGVVIVTPTGRGWIPVGLPARPLPTTIVAAAPRPGDLTLPEGPYRIRAIAE
jgi:catechol 2,3-dioxygenase-like lactoylglutathione lyase family enzyme